MLIPRYKVLQSRNLCLFRVTKSLNRGINVYSALQKSLSRGINVYSAELILIPRF